MTVRIDLFCGRRKKMGRMNQSREPGIVIDLNDRHEIETQKSQVREIILRKFFATQMCMNATEAAKTIC